MAVTEFGTNSPQTVKLWSRALMREAIFRTYLKKFLGTSQNSILRLVTDLQKQPGDEVKYDLLRQMTSYGVQGDNPLRGYEEALTYYQDSVKIDQLRNGHAFRRMSQQRTLHDMRKDGRDNLGDWFAQRFDELMFGQLAGTFTAGTSAPSGFQNFAGNTLASVTSDTDHYVNKGTETFRTSHIELLVEKAQTIAPIVRPCVIGGEEYFVLVVHPYCITDIRQDTTNSLWVEVTKFLNMGKREDNPFFSGAIGKWNNVMVYASTRIPLLNPGASQYARCLFLGANAGVLAFGNAYDQLDQGYYGSENMFAWSEEIDDHGNEKAVGGATICGIKPCIFNSKRNGMIAIDIKAVAHS